MRKKITALRADHRLRELGHGLVLMALSGTSVGGVMGMLAVATKALGR
jgi:hypothetical protein